MKGVDKAGHRHLVGLIIIMMISLVIPQTVRASNSVNVSVFTPPETETKQPAYYYRGAPVFYHYSSGSWGSTAYHYYYYYGEKKGFTDEDELKWSIDQILGPPEWWQWLLESSIVPSLPNFMIIIALLILVVVISKK